MNVHIIFGQRKESYPGEYAPEALEVMSEFDMEENPQWFEDKLKEHRANDDFENVQAFTFVVKDDAIMRGLRPQNYSLPTRMLAPEPCMKIEYDLDYSGGNYEGVGTFAYVPWDMVASLGVREAFKRHTSIDPLHVIWYDHDNHYTMSGQQIKE